MYNTDMENVPSFAWHEPKRQSNFVQHGIDFEDAKEIWQGEVSRFPQSKTSMGNNGISPTKCWKAGLLPSCLPGAVQ